MYAEQIGFLANILPAIGGSLLDIWEVVAVNASAASDKLLLSLVVFLAPSAALPLGALLIQAVMHFWSCDKSSNTATTIKIVKRAIHFWFLAIMAAFVLQIDYLVMSQFLQAHDIVIYNLTTKIFGLGVFIYAAFLKALWPTLTEAIVQNKWPMVKNYAPKENLCCSA